MVRARVLLLRQKRGASVLKRRLQWLQQQFIVMELSACTCPAGSRGEGKKRIFFFFFFLTQGYSIELILVPPTDSYYVQIKNCGGYTEAWWLMCTFLPLPWTNLESGCLVGQERGLPGMR